MTASHECIYVQSVACLPHPMGYSSSYCNSPAYPQYNMRHCRCCVALTCIVDGSAWTLWRRSSSVGSAVSKSGSRCCWRETELGDSTVLRMRRKLWGGFLDMELMAWRPCDLDISSLSTTLSFQSVNIIG